MHKSPEQTIPVPPSPRPHLRLGWLLLLGLLGVIWFLLVGLLAPTEAIVGLGAIGLTLLVAVRLARVNLARFQARTSWLAQARQLPQQVLHDSVAVIAVLVQQGMQRHPPPGRFRVV